MDDLLGERLNGQPLIFRGYSDSELMAAIGLAAAVTFPLGLVIGLVAGSIAIGLGIGMIGMLVLVAGGSSLYQLWKRGRPNRYLEQAVHFLSGNLGFGRGKLCRHRGCMGTLRGWKVAP